MGEGRGIFLPHQIPDSSPPHTHSSHFQSQVAIPCRGSKLTLLEKTGSLRTHIPFPSNLQIPPPLPPFLFDCQLPFRLRGNRRTSSSVRQSFRFSSPSLPLVRKSRQLMLSVQKKKKKIKETGRKKRKCSGRNQTRKLLRKEMGRTAAADKKRSLIAFLPPFRSGGNVRKSVPVNARQKICESAGMNTHMGGHAWRGGRRRWKGNLPFPPGDFPPPSSFLLFFVFPSNLTNIGSDRRTGEEKKKRESFFFSLLASSRDPPPPSSTTPLSHLLPPS